MLRDKDGFLYHIGKGDINHRLWRCGKRSCNSTTCTEPEDGKIIWKKPHNHAAKMVKAEYKSLFAEAKRMADQDAGSSTQ